MKWDIKCNELSNEMSGIHGQRRWCMNNYGCKRPFVQITNLSLSALFSASQTMCNSDYLRNPHAGNFADPELFCEQIQWTIAMKSPIKCPRYPLM